MDLKQLFKRHYLRLVLEAALRAALIGLAAGFATNAMCGLFAWLFSFGGIWFPILSGAGVAVAVALLVYFLKLKPDPREVARRMDTLGLEERTVTMLELRSEQTYIAKVQRANATEHIQKVSDKKIRIRIPRAVICLAAAAAVVGASMTTVVGLTEQGIIDQPPMPGEPDPMESYLSVTYEAGDGGEIEGETDQLLPPGSDSTPVVAVPEDGWVFVSWDDGRTDPERHESEVTTDLYYTAIFEQISEDGDSEGESDAEGGDGSGEGDKAEDIPAGSDSNADSDQQGGKGEEGDASGS